jgi:surface protein
MLYSSGRTTGPKGGAGCPLRILSTFNTFSIFYPLQGINVPCTFTNVLSFVKPEFDPSLSTICVNPIFGGDSGSALIADFGGVRKIIGLVFASGQDSAGNTIIGYACRIDVVAAQMGIQAWDCTNKSFVDESSIVYQTVPGLSCNETLQCSPLDPVYYQAGVTNTLSNPCPPPLIINFTTTWETTTASESIELPYQSWGTYTGTINWGDGNITPNSYANRIHTYLTAGTYTVIINGDCIGWNFDSPPLPLSAAKIKSVVYWGQLQAGASFGFSRAFAECTNLDLSSVLDTLDLTGAYALNLMFLNCTSLTTINNINSWNTIGVGEMIGMFWNCTSFNQALSFNTSNVTNMQSMFSNCTSFNSLLTFNTGAVMDMRFMFFGCLAFNQAVNFNTSAVNLMYGMFQFATAFNQPLSFNTGAVTNMSAMFNGASSFNQPLTWDTSSLIEMEGMFESATAFNSTLTFSSLASVTTMYNFFRDATSFNQPLTWDMPLNTRLGFMFKGCTVFNSPITFTNTSNVFDINRMFKDCPVFNQPITFDTSAVIWPMHMFDGAIAFNRPLTQGVNGWDTSLFTGLGFMFNNAIAFNQDISSWDVSNILPNSANPTHGCANFMSGKTPATWSQLNFDNLLCAWSLQIVNPAITIDFGTAQFSNATGLACENVLTSPPNNWIVNSGGGV